MSSPAEFYHSLPPISKAYGTICVLATTAYQLGLYDFRSIALIHKLVFSHFQVWRLITNFFFLGNFSINFGIRLLMIARYGVQLEKGPFERRTADFLWMMIFGALTLLVLSAIPLFWSPFLGISLVFMLVYVWSREFPNASVNIYGLVALKAFYLPWAMLALDVIFGSPIMPDLLGIIAGHLYYFLTVLHPLAGGKNILQTPRWVYPYFRTFCSFKVQSKHSCTIGAIINSLSLSRAHIIYLNFSFFFASLLHSTCSSLQSRHKVVARWRIGAPPPSSRTQPAPATGGTTFRGRSYRLSG